MKRVQPILYSPRGCPKPRDAKVFVRQAFVDVNNWFFEKLGVAPIMNAPMTVLGHETWAEIGARYDGNYKDNGFNIWKDAMLDIKSRNSLNFCTPNRGIYLIYFHPPLPQWVDPATGLLAGEGNPVGMGGMVGNENWGCVSPRPGTACIGDRMAYLLCGKTSEQIEAMGWPHAWPDSPNHPRGGIAHEIVHMFTDLPHAHEPGAQLTEEWYAWPDTGFLPEEEAALKAALA